MPIRTVNDSLLRPAQTATPESSFTEQFNAMFGEAAVSGLLGSGARVEELNLAEGQSSVQQFGRAAESFASPQETLTPRTLSPMLTPEAARAKLRDAGLSESLSVPVTGIREAALSILIDRKRDELRRQSILSRPGGSWPVRLAGAFIGSLVDPSNIALAFVPVVGEARYAALLAQATSVVGRTGVRVGVGAAEGLVGLIPAEIANYTANVQQQADYDAYDSMLSIAGGAAFGAALHAGFGLFPEAMGRYRRPTRAEAVVPPSAAVGAPPGAISPLAPAVRAPDLDALARQADETTVLERLAEGRPLTREAATERAAATLFARLRQFSGEAPPPRAIAAAKAEIAALTARIERYLPEREAALTRELAQTQRRNQSAPQALATAAKRAKEIVGRERRELESRRAELASAIEHHAGISEFESIVRSGDLARLPASVREAVEREADRLLDTDGRNPLSKSVRDALARDPFAGIRPVIAASQPETQALAFRIAAAQMARGEPIDVTPAFLTDPAFRDLDAASSAARANIDRLDGAVDTPVSPEVTAAVKRATTTDEVDLAREYAKEVEADVKASLASIGQKLDDTEIESMSLMLAKAKRDGEAAKVAAMCMMRTGG